MAIFTQDIYLTATNSYAILNQRQENLPESSASRFLNATKGAVFHAPIIFLEESHAVF